MAKTIHVTVVKQKYESVETIKDLKDANNNYYEINVQNESEGSGDESYSISYDANKDDRLMKCNFKHNICYLL